MPEKSNILTSVSISKSSLPCAENCPFNLRCGKKYGDGGCADKIHEAVTAITESSGEFKYTQGVVVFESDDQTKRVEIKKGEIYFREITPL